MSLVVYPFSVTILPEGFYFGFHRLFVAAEASTSSNHWVHLHPAGGAKQITWICSLQYVTF